MVKTSTKNKWGRPTKYKEEMCQMVDDYLSDNQDYYQERLKGKWIEEQLKVKLPTLESFSVYLGIQETTLYQWKAKYPKFSQALRKISIEQKKRLMEMSLSWEYNSTIAKLILSANHWMSEWQRIEHTWKVDMTMDFAKMSLIEMEEQRKKLLDWEE